MLEGPTSGQGGGADSQAKQGPSQLCSQTVFHTGILFAPPLASRRKSKSFMKARWSAASAPRATWAGPSCWSTAVRPSGEWEALLAVPPASVVAPSVPP